MICDSNDLYHAMLACAAAHVEQKDKAGNPYLMHPLAVAAAGADLDEIVLGLLHDVVEDTEETVDALQEKYGFPDALMNALEAISKKDGESLESYLKRVVQNELAVRVKIHDMNHNSDHWRLSLLGPQKAKFFAEKYEKAKQLLEQYRYEATNPMIH